MGIIRDSPLFEFFFKPSTLLLEDQTCESRSEKHDPQDFLLLLKLIIIKKELIKRAHFAADNRACISFGTPYNVRKIISQVIKTEIEGDDF